MIATDLVKDISIQQVTLDEEVYFKISNSDAMRPFFMSIVSDANHWLFISSNGGLTAGRKDSEQALFPYTTDDKITESAEITGSKSLFRIGAGSEQRLWEPFSERFDGLYQVRRNLYKSLYGNKIIFEEINEDLGLTFRYAWNTSDQYGFVKQSHLINHSGAPVQVDLLDGLQNIMPFGVPTDLQMRSSNLVDAYKKSELDPTTGLGIFALSAIIVDKAEPSEALKANVAWSAGLEKPTYLLSSRQLPFFRKGKDTDQEVDVRGEKGAYFVRTQVTLSAGQEQSWMIVADVNKDHAALARLQQGLATRATLANQVQADIDRGTQRLLQLTGSADGLQHSGDPLQDARHFSNTLFNIMRGGIFDDHYQIERDDFTNYLAKANRDVSREVVLLLRELPHRFTLHYLQRLAAKSDHPDFQRLALEYLPLKFSRRHGDPSRPWNKFSINTRAEDGSKILDYEGNWRDIFQNWEALALSYPGFIESMIHKFLNATTFDGYNPYRVTKDGFDWETIEPDDPWSYIGYWGDHQIIYLLKLLELLEKHRPGSLADLLHQELFVYANVPYRIKAFSDILENPKDTIDFDQESDQRIRAKREEIGADGALLTDQSGAIYHVNLLEKILATLLAKLSNFVPEGGIWMNTQRPEWNDANNALVGNGVSMVTLYYLRRFLTFWQKQIESATPETIAISGELHDFFSGLAGTLTEHRDLLKGTFSDRDRYLVLAGLGEAASRYRLQIYDQPFSGQKAAIHTEDLKTFVGQCLAYVDHTIAANQRPDHLYHAYNLLTVGDGNEVSISHLDEMLEGQVAVLSAGYLPAGEALAVLDALKSSRLFREDQFSYILYPDKDLPRFVDKNTIPAEGVRKSKLLQKLLEMGNTAIISQDIQGVYHFNGAFRNAVDLRKSLEALPAEYASLVKTEKAQLLKVFENIFNHKAFTGRSGTFFGYEGLGSIYWHMVSKLVLATQECCLQAIRDQEPGEVVGRLLEHYYELSEGIGIHKSPALYGAFPTDPYSHTPAGKGAQQPGMTGQVKEDILSRFGELGVAVDQGKLTFHPTLLRKESFTTEHDTFHYVDISGANRELDMPAGSLCFTYCQVPIRYQMDKAERLVIEHTQSDSREQTSMQLDAALSQAIFSRTGEVQSITVFIAPERLR
jgi:hypothetical protein